MDLPDRLVCCWYFEYKPEKLNVSILIKGEVYSRDGINFTIKECSTQKGVSERSYHRTCYQSLENDVHKCEHNWINYLPTMCIFSLFDASEILSERWKKSKSWIYRLVVARKIFPSDINSHIIPLLLQFISFECPPIEKHTLGFLDPQN